MSDESNYYANLNQLHRDFQAERNKNKGRLTDHAETLLEKMGSDLLKSLEHAILKQSLELRKDKTSREALASDVCVKIIAKLKSGDYRISDAKLTTYCFNAVRNALVDQTRLTQKTQPTLELNETIYTKSDDSDPFATIFSSSDPDSLVLKRIKKAVDGLPQEMKRAFKAYYFWHEMPDKYQQQPSTAELAKEFNISKSTIKMALDRSRDKLKLSLQNDAVFRDALIDYRSR